MTAPKASPDRREALIPQWLRSRRVWQCITFGIAVAMYVIASEAKR